MGQTALLQALGYPKANTFNSADQAAFRALVVWLENVKVRVTARLSNVACYSDCTEVQNLAQADSPVV